MRKGYFIFIILIVAVIMLATILTLDDEEVSEDNPDNPGGIEDQLQGEGECAIENDGTDPCPEGYICYWSRVCSRGEECEQVTGDSLCHKICDSDEDCTSKQKCEEVRIWRGDSEEMYKFCK